MIFIYFSVGSNQKVEEISVRDLPLQTTGALAGAAPLGYTGGSTRGTRSHTGGGRGATWPGRRGRWEDCPGWGTEQQGRHPGPAHDGRCHAQPHTLARTRHGSPLSTGNRSLRSDRLTGY